MKQIKSDISQTNQLEILDEYSTMAEKLFKYLFKKGRGIDSFRISSLEFTDEERKQTDFYLKTRHNRIKLEIQKRLTSNGEEVDIDNIRYSVTIKNPTVFFLSKNNTHSGWKKLYEGKWNTSERERILNLIFKFHLLERSLLPQEIDTINGFEELMLLHEAVLPIKQDKHWLRVWGQNINLNFNYHDIITINLTRTCLLFFKEADYKSIDGEELGELFIHEEKKYRLYKKLDARKRNAINFMQFPKENKDYKKFKRTQVYFYNLLLNKICLFLEEIDVAYKKLPFQTNLALENAFITHIDNVENLIIINNIGIDFSEKEQCFISQLLKRYGTSTISFYNNGNSINAYEKVLGDNEQEYWRITTKYPWSKITLDKAHNYLVINKELDEGTGSMAYKEENGLWFPSSELSKNKEVDFYTSLKRKLDFIKTGHFISIQGINLKELSLFETNNSLKNSPLLHYSGKVKGGFDYESLYEDISPFMNKEYKSVEDAIHSYLKNQSDTKEWKDFCEEKQKKHLKTWESFSKFHKIKMFAPLQKVIMELGIKNWVRRCLKEPDLRLKIGTLPFEEKQFTVIYVRKPKKQEAKIVAVNFTYKDGGISIDSIEKDRFEIEKKFSKQLRRNKNGQLKNDQQIYVDGNAYISCYTDDYYTSTLIGKEKIIDGLKNNTLKIDRSASEEGSRFFPLVSYYNTDIKPINKVGKMVCIDSTNDSFLQYFVPPLGGLQSTIKKGFRVYHVIGNRNSDKKYLTSSELLEHPLTKLHFHTLTQNVLRINENSVSSLLQKIARVLVDN